MYTRQNAATIENKLIQMRQRDVAARTHVTMRKTSRGSGYTVRRAAHGHLRTVIELQLRRTKHRRPMNDTSIDIDLRDKAWAQYSMPRLLAA